MTLLKTAMQITARQEFVRENNMSWEEFHGPSAHDRFPAVSARLNLTCWRGKF